MPSINLPLTNQQGIIHPIWYEFFRAVISNLGTASTGTSADNTVIAGAGILGTSAVSTVNVGQGEGLSVSDNAVSVNITGQINAQAAAEDEILIADASDQSRIRKTSLRDVVSLSRPGGSAYDVQFNDGGLLGGNSGFTTDGAGSVSISNMTFNGNTITTTNTDGDLNITPNGSGAIVFSKVIHNAAGTNTSRGISFTGNGLSLYGLNSTAIISMNGSVGGWNLQADTSKLMAINTTEILVTGLQFRMLTTPILRCVTSTITASTTQTQGQQPLTSDINEVSVCANLNDTVTLPLALAGRSCLVINNGAQTLQVFPASGDDLGAGLNTSTTITSGSRKWFVAFDTTNWEAVI